MNIRFRSAPPFILVEAFRGLIRYPLRTSLALLGLATGVASVVGTVALLAGAERMATDSLARFSALDVVALRSPDSYWSDGHRVRITKRAALDEADVARIRAAVPGARETMLQASAHLPVRHLAASFEVDVIGVGSNAPNILTFDQVRGRFLGSADERDSSRSAVVSEGLAADLFGEGSPLGEEIMISSQRFAVIGVVRPRKDWQGDDPRAVYVPYRTVLDRLGAVKESSEILVAAGSAESLARVQDAIEAMAPHLRAGLSRESYEISSEKESLEAAASEARMRRAILGGVAFLSMIAAGSGILNTLLVGVRERTREIGTRRALGARRSWILRQFLVESAVLALPGALAGLAAGSLVARLLGAFLAAGLQDPSLLHVAVGSREAVSAVVAAVLVSIFAGLWPAWQASRISPAEALRYE